MILLVLWLLLHAPSTTFFSERPHLVSLAVDREVASRVDSYVLDLLPPEDHANSTRSGYDVSGFLDPVKVIHTVGAFVAVITIAWLALHFILHGGSFLRLPLWRARCDSVAREKAISTYIMLHEACI